MKKRHFKKVLKSAAVKEANKLKDFGYDVYSKWLNQKTMIVYAENKYENYKVFVNKKSGPYSTAKQYKIYKF